MADVMYNVLPCCVPFLHPSLVSQVDILIGASLYMYVSLGFAGCRRY